MGMILKGDCIEVMKAIKPNSVDAIVCDPPYGLEFMGKEWDKLWDKRTIQENKNWYDPRNNSFQKYNPISYLHDKSPSKYQAGKDMQLWHTQWLTEAYRVLKPGGSMLVMGGTRTSHRLACAIEDSGFIIKDTLMFMYGSGFPKAQDLGKMIDKRNGRKAEDFKRLGEYLKQQRGNRPQKNIAKFFPSKTGGLTGCVANWELGLNVPTAKQYSLLKDLLKLNYKFDWLIKREQAEREKIGETKYAKLRKGQRYTGFGSDVYQCGMNPKNDIDETAPSTDLAKHWDGFKVGGIKPAYESIIWATKTLTDIDYFSIMVHKVKELLCHILKLRTIKEGKTNTEKKTQHGISQHGIEGKVASSEAMDMLLSEFTKRYKSLNIVLSWKNILEESLKAGNTYITEMASCTITDLRILNSLLTQNTQEDVIPKKKTLQDGEELNASLVVDILIGVLAKLNAILISSITELAISQGEKQDSHPNLKPNFSPITWAVKPPEGSYVDNVLKWGVGAVNVDECRVGTQDNLNGGTYSGEHREQNENSEWQNKDRSEGKGSGFRRGIGEFSPPKGRFPANVILSHHPECVQVGVKRVKGASGINKIGERGAFSGDKYGDEAISGKLKQTSRGYGLETVESWDCHPDCAVRLLDEQSGVSTGFYRPNCKNKSYKGTAFGGGEVSQQHNDSGGASRFFYCAKSSRSERNKGLDNTVSIDIMKTWKEKDITKQESLVRLLVDMDKFPPRAIVVSGTKNKSVIEWSTSWFGKNTLERYQKGSGVITKIGTSSIMISRILKYLTLLLTKEYIADVKLLKGNGGSPVVNVDNSNQLIITISESLASRLGVKNAVSKTQLKISVKEGRCEHPTVKPVSLFEYLIKLVTRQGQIILDPFIGSGTTAIAAHNTGRKCVGIEKEDEYLTIAKRRIDYWKNQPKQMEMGL